MFDSAPVNKEERAMQKEPKRVSWLSAMRRLRVLRNDRGAVRTVLGAAVLALAAVVLAAVSLVWLWPDNTVAIGSNSITRPTAGRDAGQLTLLDDGIVFQVDSTGDAGDDMLDGTCDDGEGKCTLRAAIEEANSSTGITETIRFALPTPGPHTIQPSTALPIITDPVIIDGYAQPGANPNTNPPELGSNAVLKIQLDGLNAGISANGLRITGGGSTVRGLAIGRFDEAGISLENNGGNTIEGNFLGTDVTGMLDRGNGTYGVIIHGSSNTIGGTDAGARNVISGNSSYGVVITGVSFTATENVVLGNLIGSDVTGTAALENGGGGVMIDGASTNTIGGTRASARNVISGNWGYGVEIEGTLATGNLVEGNFIGLQVDGTSPLGNADDGVSVGALLRSSNNVIGGVAPGAGNTIAYNTGDGVRVYGDTSTGNTIRGNSIHSNGGLGIDNVDGGNGELEAPVITSASTDRRGPITGTACSGCAVEVFSDNDGEGRQLLGHTVALGGDGSPSWTLWVPAIEPYVTATATETGEGDGSTSEFSDPYEVPGERTLQYSSQHAVVLASAVPGVAADVELDIRVPTSSLTTDSVRMLMRGSEWFTNGRPDDDTRVGDAIVELDAGIGEIIKVTGGEKDEPIPLYAVSQDHFSGTLGQLPEDINPSVVQGAFKANGSDLHIWLGDDEITDDLLFRGTGYAWVVDRGDGKTELVLGTEGYTSIPGLGNTVRVTRIHLNLRGQVDVPPPQVLLIVRQNPDGDGYYPLVFRAASDDNPFGDPAGGRGRELGLGMECLYIGTATLTDDDEDCLEATDEDSKGTSDADPDWDSDGLPDGYDLLCGSDNTLDTADYDGDLVEDWEECARGTKPNGSDDTDEDTIKDGVDNCPITYNLTQADLDKDGQGDACDDGDDGDYLSDKQEAHLKVNWVHDGNKSRVECSFDGLTENLDAPRERDMDGDTVLDGAECFLGSDPTNDPGRVGYECPDGVPYSVPEICDDGLDNDCDGLFDEKPTKLLIEFQEGCTKEADDPDGDGLMNASGTGISWENVAGTCRQVSGDVHPPEYPDTCDDNDWRVAGSPQMPDTDKDGRTDGQEFMIDGTSPVNPHDVRSASAVGGIAELPEVAPGGAQPVGAPPEGSGWSAGGYAALASGLAAAAFAIVAGGWYIRRRWLHQRP
jgi:hypothetical protein